MDRRKFLVRTVVLSTPPLLTLGCGTFLHPDRVGAVHSNDLDWKIVALDGLGLLLFFVPGVVAFAVDFCTGAIYLPCGPSGNFQPDVYPRVDATQVRKPSLEVTGQPELKQLKLKPDAMSLQQVQHTVSQELGEKVVLDAPGTRYSELDNLDQFAVHQQQHQDNPRFGRPLVSLFRRLRGEA